MSQNVFVKKRKEKESPMNHVTVLDIDLAKDVYQLHGVNAGQNHTLP